MACWAQGLGKTADVACYALQRQGNRMLQLSREQQIEKQIGDRYRGSIGDRWTVMKCRRLEVLYTLILPYNGCALAHCMYLQDIVETTCSGCQVEPTIAKLEHVWCER